MRELRLFVLQFKTAFMRISAGLLIMAVLFGVTAGGVYLYTRPGAGASEPGLMKVAVVYDDGFFGDYIYELAADIPGVNALCDLVRMDMDEATEALENGHIRMIIEIPDDFYERAESMQDARLIIYTRGEPSKSELKLLAMLGSVTGLMEITDAQILSLYDGMAAYDLPVDRSDMEWTLLARTYAGFGEREERISVDSVSATGAYSVDRFYLSSAVLCILLLGSVMLFSLYTREHLRMERALCRTGISYISCFAGKICAMWISMGIWTEALINILNLYLTNSESPILSGLKLRISSGMRLHICIWIVTLSVALWIHLIASVTGSDSPHFRVTYTAAMLIMIVGSGVVVPTVYLPRILRRISSYIPAGAMHGMLMGGMWDTGRIRGISSIRGSYVIIMTNVILCLVSFILYRRGLSKHD